MFGNSTGTRGPITIVLADDHALVRETLRSRLDGEAGFSVVGVASHADDAVGLCMQQRPSVLLLDLDMPGACSFSAARLVQQQVLDTRIILLTSHCQDQHVEQAMAAEVSGLVTKNEPPERLVEGIRTVAGGGVFFSSEVLSRLAADGNGNRAAGNGRSRVSSLTPRELEVLKHIAQGMSKKEIARAMHIGVKTVEHHTFNLMSKLDIHDRVKLALFAIREGLVKL